MSTPIKLNTPCTHQPGIGFKTALGAAIAGIRARLYRTCFESMRDFVTSKAKQTIPAYGCRVAMKTATQITDSTVPAKSKRLLKMDQHGQEREGGEQCHACNQVSSRDAVHRRSFPSMALMLRR
jgi:hypothetical protein